MKDKIERERERDHRVENFPTAVNDLWVVKGFLIEYLSQLFLKSIYI